MSNEIRISVAWSVTKGNVYRTTSIDKNFDQTGTLVHGPLSMALTDTYASISKGSVGTAKWLYVRNLHATKAASVSMDAGSTTHFTLATNEPMLVPLASTVTITDIKIKSATTGGEVEYAIIEA